MIGILIKYSQFYGKPVPDNPLNLLVDLPKDEVLITLAKINSLIQPIGYRSNDGSRDTQIKCLKTIFLPSENKSSEFDLFKFKKYEEYLLNLPKQYSFFSRTTCLYGLNELTQSDMLSEIGAGRYSFEERQPILDYLLICNERIISFSEKSSLEKINEEGIEFFLFNAFNQIPHNQYSYEVNVLFKFYKSKYLLQTLLTDDSISNHLLIYLKSRYGNDNIKELFKRFFWSFMNMKDEELELYFLNISKDENNILNLMQGFSAKPKIKCVVHDDINILDFLPVKKSPILKCNPINKKGFITFSILDQKFLIEKFDSLFINDFWFDYLKSNTDFNRGDWGNWLGKRFLEPFIGETLSCALEGSKEYTLKLFDDLDIEYKKGGGIEVADIYIRKKQNIFLGEVKSKYVNIIDGYKSVDSIDKFKELDLDKFFEDFGLKQLACKTIKEFHRYKEYLNDNGLNLNRKVHLFPVIIVSEPILSQGLFQFPLRRKFEEILKKNGIETNTKYHLIWPLLIMRAQELMELEQSLTEGAIDLFTFLKSYHDKVKPRLYRQQGEFKELFSLTNVIDQKIEREKLFPKRLRDWKWVIS